MTTKLIALILLTAWGVSPAFAQTTAPAGDSPPSEDQMTEIARKLNNPTASLISVPLQASVNQSDGTCPPFRKGHRHPPAIQPRDSYACVGTASDTGFGKNLSETRLRLRREPFDRID